MINLTNLNTEQKKAVICGNGPVLIVAGAGTGKTTVITYRIVYLIEQKRIKPEEVLALTFTDKAAGEMEERVDKLLSYGYADLWISTFHSFCERVLKEDGLDVGLPTDFKLLDQTASWLLVRQNLDKFKLDYYKPLGNPTKFIHALISHFSRCKDQAIFPEDYLKYSKSVAKDKDRILEIAMAYKKYQELLLKNGLLDFGDLINYCLKLFRKRPLILEKYRKQFKYLLVDEFQDTNFAQYELIKLLAGPKNNLTVCADDDQAIYRWRGASFSNVVQFRKDYPKAREIVLIKNYRSPQNILDLGYKFIQANNPNRLECINGINKNLLAVKKEKGVIQHFHFRVFEDEVQSVISKIVEISKKDKDANFSDFAILARTNETASAFARACERVNIPYQFMARKGLYSRFIILDIISYFKILTNYHLENLAVYRILKLPFFKISSDDISKITQYSHKKFKSVYEVLKELSLVSNLSAQTVDSVGEILDMIEKHTKLAAEKNVSEILLMFLEESGYLKYLTKNDKKEDLDFATQFYNRTKEFEEANIDAGLQNFMEELTLELESGEEGKLNFDIEQGPDMVRIMTIHTAKGLEFKYVFLVNLVDKRFPTINRKEPIELPEAMIKDVIPKGDMHLEEERRLFYVGVTRAKKDLFFTSAEDCGGIRKKKLSRFLSEVGYKGKEIKGRTKTRTKTIQIKEKKKESKIILPNHFSFTQLQIFEKCPLQYKFAYILKIPGRGKAVFSFGRTIHNTLYDFVAKSSIGEKIDLKKLFQIYQQKWIDEWYENKKQKNDYYDLGKKSLEKFYDNFLKTKPSIFYINGRAALEQEFNLRIAGYTINGKIDRIDKMGSGVEIIDYKTGIAKEKLSSEDKQQLLIYQIAAKEIFGLASKRLTYYYLDKGEKVSFLGSEEEEEQQKNKILFHITQIKKSDFAPTPGWQCQWCDFKNICDYAKR